MRQYNCSRWHNQLPIYRKLRRYFPRFPATPDIVMPNRCLFSIDNDDAFRYMFMDFHLLALSLSLSLAFCRYWSVIRCTGANKDGPKLTKMMTITTINMIMTLTHCLFDQIGSLSSNDIFYHKGCRPKVREQTKAVTEIWINRQTFRSELQFPSHAISIWSIFP